MPWGWGKDDADVPAKIKGKTPEEILAALEETDRLRGEVTTLKTQNTELSGKFETFGTQLEELKKRIPEPRVETRQPNDPTSFLVDGDAAFNERIAPLANFVASTAAVQARSSAMQEAQARQRSKKGNIDGMLFEKYGDEINELAKSCTPQQLAVAGTWTHLFYNVKGRHTDEIAEQNREQKGEFFVEGSQRVTAADDTKDDDKLTATELRIAQRMGVSPENYLKQKKSMSVGGMPEGLSV